MTRDRDRMPPIAPADMSAEQRQAAQEILDSRRGAIIGPFIPALRSAEFTRRLQKLGEYLRYDAALPQKLRELAILLTARQWTQSFEWDVHAPLAEQAGLSPAVIAAIAEARRPEPMDRGESIVYAVFEELHRTQTITDATFAAAVTAFGEQGLIDLIGIIGYYATLAMIMNVARTPLPAGHAPALKPRTKNDEPLTTNH